MSFKEKTGFLFVLPLLAIISSCSARIDGVVRDGGSADFSVKTSLEPRTSALIGSLKSFMGDAKDGPILDGEAIGRSMAAAPGIKSVFLKNTGAAALEGNISVSNIGNFLNAGGELRASNSAPSGPAATGQTAAPGSAAAPAPTTTPGAKSRFITYTESKTAGTSSIVITLTRESAPAIIAMLSPEVEEYLSALMAPAVLGETSTKKEYLDLLASIYGRPLANETEAALIKLNVEFPRNVSSVQGGIARGRQAEFNVPLVDILVLESPLRYEVNW